MILDASRSPCRPSQPGDPVTAAIVGALEGRQEIFVVDPARQGLDLLFDQGPGTRSRIRLKVFDPDRNTTVVFVYKDSLVPFSTDRFAYGALVVKNRRLDPASVDRLLDYVASGLHPERRPAELKRAFPFTVPR